MENEFWIFGGIIVGEPVIKVLRVLKNFDPEKSRVKLNFNPVYSTFLFESLVDLEIRTRSEYNSYYFYVSTYHSKHNTRITLSKYNELDTRIFFFGK